MTKLQRLIRDTKLSDKEIARYIRLSVPTIKRYREGKSKPHPLAAKWVLTILGTIINTRRCLACSYPMLKNDFSCDECGYDQGG